MHAHCTPTPLEKCAQEQQRYLRHQQQQHHRSCTDAAETPSHTERRHHRNAKHPEYIAGSQIGMLYTIPHPTGTYTSPPPPPSRTASGAVMRYTRRNIWHLCTLCVRIARIEVVIHFQVRLLSNYKPIRLHCRYYSTSIYNIYFQSNSTLYIKNDRRFVVLSIRRCIRCS